MRYRLALATFACFGICNSPLAVAQPTAPQARTYPDKPVRFVVGYPPGGGADAATRAIVGRLGALLGQQIIVDNRPGASGNIATEIVARSIPDGYTLLMGSIAALAINPGLYPKLPFDPIRDLAPVTLIVDSTNILCLNNSVAASNVRELIALGRTKSLNAGSSGVGGTGHLAIELFNTMTGTKIVHVPYKGGGPAIIDLLAGNIQLIFANAGSAINQISAGKIRGLAVTTSKRSQLIPDLPTVAETGLPGYEANNWLGVLVPARTPPPIVARLNREIVATLGTPEVVDLLFRQGFEVNFGTPAAFSSYIKSETAKWARVIKGSGATAY